MGVVVMGYVVMGVVLCSCQAVFNYGCICVSAGGWVVRVRRKGTNRCIHI